MSELEEQKSKYRRAVDRLAELNREFQHFKDDAKERIRESDKKYNELRTIADSLEHENVGVFLKCFIFSELCLS